MRSTNFVYLLIALAATSATAQWTSLNSGTTANLNGVHFVSPTIGWAVGASGTIIKTTDGGTSWQPQVSGTSTFLYKVRFVDASTGWVTGSGGLLLKTTDGGGTWSPQTTGTTNSIDDAWFTSATHGVFVGGADAGTSVNMVKFTTDGGTTWNPRISGTTGRLYRVQMVDGSNGFALGIQSGRIIRTTNGGAGWTELTPSVTNSQGLWFSSTTHGWLPGGGASAAIVRRTTDGGGTWTVDSVRSALTLRAAQFLGVQLGWAVGAVGGDPFNLKRAIVRSMDGGASWTSKIDTLGPQLTALHFVDMKLGFAVGNGGSILRYQPVTLLAPNAVVQLVAGSSQPITWSVDEVANVKIEFSANFGASWSTVAASVPGTQGSFNWTVPSVTSTQCLIRISDASDPQTHVLTRVPFSVYEIPSQPNPTIPGDGAERIPLPVGFAWNGVSGATQYRLTVALDSTMSTIVRDTLVTSSNIVLPLQGSTTYWWRVRGENFATAGAPSTVRRFRTSVAVPALVLPPNHAVLTTLGTTFRWNRVAQATSYDLHIAADSLFQQSILRDSLIVDSLRTVTDLAVAATRYWRVRARSGDEIGGWSSFRRFSVTLPARSATLVRDSVRIDSPSSVSIVMHVPNVQNLTAAEVIITENGEVQSNAAIGLRFRKLTGIPDRRTSVLLIDRSSGSTAGQLDALKSGALEYVRTKTANHAVAVYAFDDAVTLVQDFSVDTSVVNSSIRGIGAGTSNRNLHGAILTGMTRWRDSLTAAAMSHGTLLALTTGADTKGAFTTEQVLSARGSKRTSVIYLNPDPPTEPLRSLASQAFHQALMDFEVSSLGAQVRQVESQYANTIYWLSYVSSKRSGTISGHVSLASNTYTGMGSVLPYSYDALGFFDAAPGMTLQASSQRPVGVDTLWVGTSQPVAAVLRVPAQFEPLRFNVVAQPSGVVTVVPQPGSPGHFLITAVGAAGATASLSVVESTSALARNFQLMIGTPPEGGGGGGSGDPPVVGTTWTLIPGPSGGDIDGIVSTSTALIATTWRGLFRSTNGGDSWHLLPPSPIAYPGRLFVVNGHLYHGSTTSNALARSTDNGETWASVNSGITSSGINAMVASGDTLYLATNNGAFRSTSGGSNWTGLSSGIPVGPTTILYALAKHGQEIFAGSAFGLYKLSSGSSPWVQVTSAGTSSVRFLASNGTTLVRGDSSPKYSTDGGTSWQNSTGASGATVNDLRSTGGVYLLGYEGSGVYRSTDGGATWVKSDAGLADKYVRQLTMKDGAWYAATSGLEQGGVYRSTDGGVSWSRFSQGLRAFKLTKMAVEGSTILVGSDGFGVFRSTNGGGSWALTNQGTVGGFSRIVRDVETSAGVWFAGTATSGVYRSTDAGLTWELKDYGVNADVNDLAVSGSSVAASTIGGGVRRSTDLGVTWAATPGSGLGTGTAQTATIVDSTIYAYQAGIYKWTPGQASWTGLGVSAGPTTAWGGIVVRADTIYVGAFGSKGSFSGSGGFFVSTDGGQSWTERGAGIQYETVNAMAVSDNAVIVSNRYGTWRTNSKGVTWTDVTEGLPLVNGSDLRISGNVIYGVYGADLYVRQLDRVTSVEQVDHSHPTDFDLAQNYPNPFNPSTTIRFSLPTEGRVSLKIYDQLGREVTTLVNGNMGAGMHEARWDASGMASGLYFFRIEAVGSDGARFIRTNKMVLMK
ncbi:MAG: YCF48-related protein [Bacteroidetes bacterium]|jgi:photosystem II stability/assembly factor-like uncharacterized protein|nr:YCF48-related protein [Bacteroidota bacterium]